jgi:hypothetical protein
MALTSEIENECPENNVDEQKLVRSARGQHNIFGL